ncbi:hypothetical protein DDD_1571 [Nonlabens dokdonensis DSW-6]|uniref:Uncharacterized protein n=1 Tax=Nonlabens dokdonensis (strain DSM 17205 / KCTC 12402 / DSW-6) TaxID=592029 RepID=L7W8Z5_NONDD|nr:hypothetical protein DDD_1571 [Nonlabens dokdonensis DSW-6]
MSCYKDTSRKLFGILEYVIYSAFAKAETQSAVENIPF